jgi:hypothetical protein
MASKTAPLPVSEGDETADAASPFNSCYQARPFLWLLAILGVAKAGILLVNGPTLLPDSGGYISYADAILDHARAFAPVMWGADAAPPFVFRPPGYPIVSA